MHKIALGIEYNGRNYKGWQTQMCVPSIQSTLEKAISYVAGQHITTFCAGRTDAGVHGIGQVVHFESPVLREKNAWSDGINANLPSDVSVKWVKNVDSSFHARFSAIARQYYYIIYNENSKPAILSKQVTYKKKELDVKKMHHAAQYLLGEHDFTSFRASKCQSLTPWRNVYHIKVVRTQEQCIVVDIKADSFLYRMVRNIVGSLIEVGSGKHSELWMKRLLFAKNRKLAAATAIPDGLYLVHVEYPKYFDIPKNFSIYEKFLGC